MPKWNYQKILKPFYLDQLHEISTNIIPSSKQTFTVCYWRWIFPWFHGDLLVDLVGPITSAGTTTKKSPNLAVLRGRQGRARVRRTCILCIMNCWLSGWWLTNPSEKYESQLGLSFPIYWKIKNVWNHQPEKLVASAEITNYLYIFVVFLSIYYMIWCFLLSMHKPFRVEIQTGLLWARKRQFVSPNTLYTLSKTILAFCCPYTSVSSGNRA